MHVSMDSHRSEKGREGTQEDFGPHVRGNHDCLHGISADTTSPQKITFDRENEKSVN